MSDYANLSPAALESALVLARTLHAAAASLREKRPGRDTARDTATALWRGPHRLTFDGLYENENNKSIATETALEFEATQWAAFWQMATNARTETIHNAQVGAWHTAQMYGSDVDSTEPPIRPPDVGLPTGPDFIPATPVFYY